MGEVTSSRRHCVLPSSHSTGEAVYMLWLFVSVRLTFSLLTVLLLTFYIRALVRTSHMFVILYCTVLCCIVLYSAVLSCLAS
jgi:hypothetical protein